MNLKPGQEPYSQGCSTETMEECCMLTYTGESQLANSAAFIVQRHLPEDGTANSRLNPHTSTHNEDNHPQIYP